MTLHTLPAGGRSEGPRRRHPGDQRPRGEFSGHRRPVLDLGRLGQDGGLVKSWEGHFGRSQG